MQPASGERFAVALAGQSARIELSRKGEDRGARERGLAEISRPAYAHVLIEHTYEERSYATPRR